MIINNSHSKIRKINNNIKRNQMIWMNMTQKMTYIIIKKVNNTSINKIINKSINRIITNKTFKMTMKKKIIFKIQNKKPKKI